MTLKEAMKWNEDRITRVGNFACKEELDALKLGNEALRRENANREDPDGPLCGLLPGETAE